MVIRRKDDDLGVTGCLFIVAENETHKVYCDKPREEDQLGQHHNYCRYHQKILNHAANYKGELQ